jgi:hypothetical protein
LKHLEVFLDMGCGDQMLIIVQNDQEIGDKIGVYGNII